MFEGVKETTASGGYIAIDDIKVARGACPNIGDCSFEDGSLCEYKNLATNQLDWQVFKGYGPNSGTSPTTDHTLGSSNGFYAMISELKICF